MPKQKDKALNKKYVEVLEKFGLLPEFDFSKKEKAIVKALAESGDMDLFSLGDACQFKPEKTRKVCNKLLKKGAIEEEGDLIRLSPLALRYLHANKKIRKSAKKFYRFMDTLTEKELDEFMKLVDTFKVMPEEPTVEIEMEERQEEAPAPKPVPRKVTPRRRTTRKRSTAKPRAKKAAEPKAEATPKEE